MKLAIVSHKECWNSNGKFVTVGGFPQQVQTISRLFSEVDFILPLFSTPVPAGVRTFLNSNALLTALPAPKGTDLRRKIAMLTWLPRHALDMWRIIRSADSVHALVPGDIGFIGLLIALAQRKPLFVRHCGTWGEPVTIADRLLLWLLERIAGGRNVVMATGGGDKPPSARNSNITWIHSTTLPEAELNAIPPRTTWQPGEQLNLVFVGRLSAGKNTIDAIRALPRIQAHYPNTVLHIVGDGAERQRLERAASALESAESVVFHGNVEHDAVLRILQTCDIFVFPTQTKEGFPKAVLEAMACGLPVVATAVSVIPHLLGEERGIALQEISDRSVADAVLALLSDPERLAHMAHACRHAARDYTLERWQAIIAQRLEEAWGQPLQQSYSERHA